MFWALDLKYDLNTSFSGMQLDTFTNVLDFNDVCVIGSAYINKFGQRARAVG
jgi:hypothetical protein